MGDNIGNKYNNVWHQNNVMETFGDIFPNDLKSSSIEGPFPILVQ
jgi:hypothetical protein